MAASQVDPAMAQSAASSQVAPVEALAEQTVEMQTLGEAHWALAVQEEVTGKRHCEFSQIAVTLAQSAA